MLGNCSAMAPVPPAHYAGLVSGLYSSKAPRELSDRTIKRGRPAGLEDPSTAWQACLEQTKT